MKKTKTCCFFGHRNIIRENFIIKTIKPLIIEKINDNYLNFIVGTHGQFDLLVYEILKELKRTFKKITISRVFTNLSILNKEKNFYKENILLYDIENIHYKKRIIYSNECMINDSDLIICYVNNQQKNSGAKKSLNYAIKKNKLIINLFDKNELLEYEREKLKIRKELEKFLNTKKDT